jgi:KDO2-lipid IV(A) lauroyltransferase
VGAHLANFELLYVLLARLAPESLYVVRPPNNPWITGPLDRLRRAGGGRTSPKGRPAARAAVAVLRRNGLVLMLADQRMSEGIQARFFGHLAGAPPGPAHMALRHGAALLPVRMERVAPVRFRVTVEPPIPPPPADADAPARELTETIHRRFETWIRARPEDWLWLHRRWPKSAYDASPD